MSVVSGNPFALLDDDSPAPAPVATKAKAGGAPAAAEAPKRTTDNRRGGPAARSGRYPGRGGGTRTTPRSDDVKNEDASEAPKRFDGEKARRGGTRGRGEGRGDGRGRGRGRGGPRADRPDRHSATGIVDSDKKLHQGWGGDTGDGEQLAEAQGQADAAAAATGDWGGAAAEASGWDAPAGEGATGDAAAAGAAGENGDADAAKKAYRERRAREDEEDENLKTLEEYRKSQTTGLEELVPKLAVRAANDGKGDDSLFKGAKKLEKDEEEDSYFVGKTKAGPRARAQKEAKQTIEIDGRFDRPSRGGGGGGEGRGGRGGGGGRGRGDYRGGDRGRGRGAPRGAAPRSAAPQEVNVDDASAFPSLKA